MEKIYHRLLSLVSLLLLFMTAAAAPYSVIGEVRDSLGEPESFATIRLYQLTDTVTPLSGGVAGEDGKFLIDIADPGDYRVNISSFGKNDFNKNITLTNQSPVADLGTVILDNTTGQLEELVVTGQRPLISKEIDRIGYDVQADNDSKTSQLDEILKKVPLVSVDADGTIKVKGSTDFKIYKNGRPNNSFSRNAKDIFRALPASMIKKIEVITDPGSREDAEGTSAILNIVTMENTVVKGVMGNLSLRYNRYDSYPAPNIWLNSQIDKFNLSFYGGLNPLSRRSNKSSSESLTKYDNTGNELLSTNDTESHGKIIFTGIDMSFELDTLNLFTAEFGGYWYNINYESNGKNIMRAPDGALLYSYRSRGTTSPNSYADFNGGFNYQRSTRKKGEAITFSYMISTTDQKQNSITLYDDEENMPVPYTGTNNDFHLNFIEQTGQIDWTRPITDIHKFDLGTKYINRRNHSINNQEYFDYQKTHSNFIHTTQVLALYFDYRVKYKKFGARAGLRYEYSHLGAKYRDGSENPFSSSLNDWVPNAALSYDLNDFNTLKLSYSTRINRPGISQLNPAVVNTPSSISSGNPDLGSSRYQSFNLNYSLMKGMFNLEWTTAFSFSNNAVISVQELLAGDILKSGYANAGRNRSFYTGLWTQWNVTRKTQLMLMGNANYQYSSNKSLGLKEHGWGFNTNFRVRQQLPYNFDIAGMFTLYNGTPGLYYRSPFSFKDCCYYTIDITKSLLKEKRLTLRAGIRNPFMKGSRKYVSIPQNAGYTGYSKSYSYNNSNIFYFSVSYRFGSLNASVKKTAASISNDDLEGRKN